MSEGKYVFFIGTEDRVKDGFTLITKFARDSEIKIRAHGLGVVLAALKREVPEVTGGAFEHATSELLDITLRGKKAKGSEEATAGFAHEVVAKLDAIVTRIMD